MPRASDRRHQRSALSRTRRAKLLFDVLTCVRHHCTIEHAGFLLEKNAERHLKPAR